MENSWIGRILVALLFLLDLAVMTAPCDSYAGKFGGGKVKQRIMCATALTIARHSENIVQLGPDDALAFYTTVIHEMGGNGRPLGSHRQGVEGTSESPSFIQDRIFARVDGLISDIGFFKSNWTMDVKDVPKTYPANFPRMLVARVSGKESIREFINSFMIFSYTVDSLSSVGFTLFGDILHRLSFGAASSLFLSNYDPNFGPAIQKMLEMVGTIKPEKAVPDWSHYGVTSRSNQSNDDRLKGLEFALNLKKDGPSCPGLAPFTCRYLYWLYEYSRGETKMDLHLRGSSSSLSQELYIAWRADRPSLPSQQIRDWISLGGNGPI